MGLFGPSKIKITPNDFVKTQLNKIFSANFIDAEEKSFANLSKEISSLKMVSLDKYLKERQNVIYNLLQLSWDRTIPYDIFIEYSSIMRDDPRGKAVNSGGYDMLFIEGRASRHGYFWIYFDGFYYSDNSTRC